MPWALLPLRDLSTHRDGDNPITLVGGADALASVDNDTSYLELQLLASGTDFGDHLSWYEGTFDASSLPAGDIVIDELWVRFENRGNGTLSYSNIGVYSGDELDPGTPGVPSDLVDMINVQADRTSNLWIESENPVDNPSALRYDLDFNSGVSPLSPISVDALRAGTVRGVIWNDFGGTSLMRWSYVALRVKFLYAGDWQQGPDFEAVPSSTTFPDAWQPVKATPVDRSWTYLQFPSTESAASTGALADGWDHISVGDDGTAFWHPGSPVGVTDPSESSDIDNSTTASDGSKLRGSYALDYTAPFGVIGDSTKWSRRDVVFQGRPETSLWNAYPSPDVPADAVRREFEADYATPTDGYGDSSGFRFFNYLVRIDWKVDDQDRPPLDSGGSDSGDIEGRVFPKLWQHDPNGLGPFTGTGNEGLSGAFFPYEHTDRDSSGSLIGTLIHVDVDGVASFDTPTPVTHYEPGTPWRYPFESYPPPSSDTGIPDDYEPKWHATFVFVSDRTSEPGVTAADWSEDTAQIRMVVKWTMRPPRYRFLYDVPLSKSRVRQRQMPWLAQRNRPDLWPGRARQARW